METAARTGQAGGLAGDIAALIEADGSFGHLHRATLLVPGADPHDLADAAHLLCMVHGRYPGVLDLAIERPPSAAALPGLYDSAAGFATERDYLARLVVAVGPMPGTPGQPQSEAAVAQQRHALAILGRSDRIGTAFGAALALAGDWRVIPPVLDTAAARAGVAPPEFRMPDPEALLAGLEVSAPIERAMRFGAEQMLAQQRGLWALLETRASARRG